MDVYGIKPGDLICQEELDTLCTFINEYESFKTYYHNKHCCYFVIQFHRVVVCFNSY